MSVTTRAAVCAGAVAVGAVLLFVVGPSGGDARLGLFTPRAVSEVRQIADEAGHEPSDDEMLSVLGFRHVCRVAWQVGEDTQQVELLRGAGVLMDRIGQPHSAQFVRWTLVRHAEREDSFALQEFVRNECDPSQDMSVPVAASAAP